MSFVYSIMLRIERILSQIFLPGMYPDLFSCIKSGRTCFNLSAMTLEAIFASTLRREIGCQFFKLFLDFSSVGSFFRSGARPGCNN